MHINNRFNSIDSLHVFVKIFSCISPQTTPWSPPLATDSVVAEPSGLVCGPGRMCLKCVCLLGVPPGSQLSAPTSPPQDIWVLRSSPTGKSVWPWHLTAPHPEWTLLFCCSRPFKGSFFIPPTLSFSIPKPWPYLHPEYPSVPPPSLIQQT